MELDDLFEHLRKGHGGTIIEQFLDFGQIRQTPLGILKPIFERLIIGHQGDFR